MSNISINFPKLPPLVGDTSGHHDEWVTLSMKDYSLIGYFLCCHLVIENYLEAYIQGEISHSFSVSSANLNFSQKLNLIEKSPFPEEYNFIPALKHFNKLRNKLSHNIHTNIDEGSLLPLTQFLEKSHGKPFSEISTNKILEMFTGAVCSWLAACCVIRGKGNNADVQLEYERWIAAHHPS